MLATSGKVRESTCISAVTTLNGPVDTLFSKLLITTGTASDKTVVASGSMRINSSNHGGASNQRARTG